MTSGPRDTPLNPAQLTTPVQQGTPGQDVALVTARRAKAVALRLAGLTYTEIAREVGYTDKSAARVAVVQALEQVQAQGVEQLREVESMRLDRLQAAIWQAALGGNLAAVRAVLRISERRSKLLGLDAPVQIELLDGVEEQLGQLRAELASDGVYYIVPPEGDPAAVDAPPEAASSE